MLVGLEQVSLLGRGGGGAGGFSVALADCTVQHIAEQSGRLERCTSIMIIEEALNCEAAPQ